LIVESHARREEGASAVETALVIPVVMLILLFVLQACLWAHAANLVSAAAAQGAQSASLNGGSGVIAADSAKALLQSSGRSVVTDVGVQTLPGPDGEVFVRVTGRSEAILPWLTLNVASSRSGVVQEFRQGE
jgi:Flp pilus assembly protein TadG